MSDAERTASVHERMIAIIGDLPAIGKSQKNTQQNFMFRGHDDVMNALNPLLHKHGVLIVPDVLDRVTGQRTTSKGSVMYEVNLHVRYRFFGAGGDCVEASTWGEGTDMGDKATSKAMTMAFKSALNQAFAISNEDTIDADATTAEETVVNRLVLDSVIVKLAEADSSQDWAALAERAAQRDFRHGISQLTQPQVERLAARMTELLASLDMRPAVVAA